MRTRCATLTLRTRTEYGRIVTMMGARIGQRVARLPRGHGLTQAALARMVRTTRENIARIEGAGPALG